ncbi:hypothetical protein CGK04_23090 [Vibrio parahaemolyticus]|nr:hypothetical protein CGK04_23090 [Vibrio parahaemolyticus]
MVKVVCGSFSIALLTP